MSLVGLLEPGDVVAWAVDCRAVSHWSDPAFGEGALTTFTFPDAGSLKLCFRPRDGDAFVEQVAIALQVTAAAVPAAGRCFPKLVTFGKPFEGACSRPVRSFEACAEVAAEHPEVAGGPRLAVQQASEDRPRGCWWQHSNGALYFNLPHPEDDGAVACSKSFKCLCCGEEPPSTSSTATFTTTSADKGAALGRLRAESMPRTTTTTTTTARPGPCDPEVVIFGRPFGETCPQPVLNLEECAAVASAALGLPAAPAPHRQAAEDRPFGCWWQPSNARIYFNLPPAGAKPVDCSDNSRCICCGSAEPVVNTCRPTEYQTSALVLECAGGSGFMRIGLADGEARSIMSLPAGAIDVRVEAAAGLELRLVDTESGACLVGKGCAHSVGCADETSYCIDLGGSSVHFSGKNATETIAVTGSLHRGATVSARAVAGGSAAVAYSYGPLTPCPGLLPGCAACGSYPGCGPLGVPVCDGSAVVACSDRQRAGAITDVSPRNVSAGAATSLSLMGKVAPGDQVAFARSCGKAARAAAHTLGAKASHLVVTFASTGTFKLCYKAAGSSAFAEQAGLLLAVREATSALAIADVSPRSIIAGVATTLLLVGTVAEGDRVALAPDCAAAAPFLELPEGTDRFATFAPQAPGTLQLCLRARGGTDSVAQAGIALTVRETMFPPEADCQPALVASGKPSGDGCLQPMQSLEACTGAAARMFEANATGEGTVPEVATQVAEDRPHGCWWQPSNRQLFFNIPPPHSRPVGCTGKFQCLCCGTTRGGQKGSLRKAGGGRPGKPA